MFTEVVVQLPPRPPAGVRPLQHFHLCVRCGESCEQQLVPLLRGGMLQPFQEHLSIGRIEEFRCLAPQHRRFEGWLQMACEPHFFQCGRC